VKRVWLFVLLAACTQAASPPAAAESRRFEAKRGPVHLVVEVAPKNPRLSDTIKLTVTLDSPQEIEIDEPVFDKLVGTLRILEQELPHLELRDGRQYLTFVLRLEPMEVGVQELGPFVDGIEPVPVVVTTGIEGDPDLAALTPALGPIPTSREPAAAWWPWLFLLLLPLAVLLRRGRKPAPEAPLTPTQLAERELSALLADDPLARGEIQTFYSELTLIVRRYIERTSGVRAPEMTTEEFLRKAPPDERLRGFLQAADLVKFAGARPARPDIDESVARARHFVGLAA